MALVNTEVSLEAQVSTELIQVRIIGKLPEWHIQKNISHVKITILYKCMAQVLCC